MKKIGLFSLLALLTLTATGCGVDASGNIDRTKVWGGFVGLISDAIDYFGKLIGDYGVSILIITLIIRILIFPLMYKQLKHSKLMQELQPEMTKIREKYKNDPQKMNQEMMKLFQEKGTNPLAGCFPILIQMPILIALYQAIMYNKHISQSTFLGLIALGQPEHFVLPALAAITTYIQTRMTMMNPNDPQQKMMLYIMPAMIFFFAFTFPAALSLYWVFGNILTIIQYYFLKRPDKAAAQGGPSK
ncbi:YidC/Oxa1 family membrane protein insertase [Effusibacillus lacus]|uniref:OxaA-like protein n=1 Tax=Effusibacillus lacus TaxID=1348429 RepID=A0A292YL07_9BACL|nr:YidC/Oxa1 family membrane protein insertase [Effusibacillus lacus]TCS75195.1 protein translocase subunit yidC [Effusibacillus lacus]GAX89140.1 OxaA-like protein precursor [Effusibacillus lacus]